jgi:outer membrane protein assembly factor BamB
VGDGYSRLHALNITAGNGGRVRWQLHVPATDIFASYAYRLGPPSVTHGIVFVGTSEGHLVAIADPSVWPSVGSKCSLESVSVADCESMGYQIVPNPAVLLNLTLPNTAVISTEPALAGGKVFIANDAGWVYMIAP